MLRRFLYCGVGALALLAVLETPGQLRAAGFRGGGGFARPVRPSAGARMMPGSGLRFDRSFRSDPRFNRRFNRSFFTPGFGSQFRGGMFTPSFRGGRGFGSSQFRGGMFTPSMGFGSSRMFNPTFNSGFGGGTFDPRFNPTSGPHLFLPF